MEIRKFQIDAFAENIFEGNPAAVCLLDEFLADEILLNIASEHNLSETAFIVENGKNYDIRWFTPVAEVNLCGHATLASAFVIFECLHYKNQEIVFQSRHSGVLKVKKIEGRYELDFPVSVIHPSKYSKSELQTYFDQSIVEVWDGKEDCLVVLKDEQAVNTCIPDLKALKKLNSRGFIITAKSHQYDFVSRFFGPRVGVDEDPVTGSAHTLLIPYWAEKLGKSSMIAKQISERGGILYCGLDNERVTIAGSAKLYSEGIIYLEVNPD